MIKLSLINSDSTFVLKLENSNFLKNAEYFNPIVDGYSDLGFFITTKLEYLVSNKLKLSGGLHLLKYSGENDFSHFEPIFSLDYIINRRLSIVMGTFQKSLMVELSDQLYFDDQKYYQYEHTNLESVLHGLNNS